MSDYIPLTPQADAFEDSTSSHHSPLHPTEAPAATGTRLTTTAVEELKVFCNYVARMLVNNIVQRVFGVVAPIVAMAKYGVDDMAGALLGQCGIVLE